MEYGEVVWNHVMEAAGCKSMVFNTHRIYPDNIFPKMAEACVKVLRTGDATDYMVFFGR